MKCPECGSVKSMVYDTRKYQDSMRIRKRQCIKCGHKWQTIEITLEKFKKFKKYGEKDE